MPVVPVVGNMATLLRCDTEWLCWEEMKQGLYEVANCETGSGVENSGNPRDMWGMGFLAEALKRLEISVNLMQKKICKSNEWLMVSGYNKQEDGR